MCASEAMFISISRRSWRPAPALSRFIEAFDLREDNFGATEVYNPLPARNDCFLQFYLKDRYRVITLSTDVVHQAPHCVLIGPHTQRREDLLWSGYLKVFTIRFTPVGFGALFGMPARLIRNVAESADLVLGRSVLELESRLAEAKDSELPRIADRYLLERLATVSSEANAATALRVIRQVRLNPEETTLKEICAGEGLGLRHTERIFQELVGVAPRMFKRLDRLKKAINLSQHLDPQDWSAIAAAAGYFDQPHLIREFKALNGATPVEFVTLGRAARLFRRDAGPLTRNRVAFVQSDAGTWPVV